VNAEVRGLVSRPATPDPHLRQQAPVERSKSPLHSEAARTVLLVSALAIGTLASRVPLLAPRLAHWDAVNYALGLHAFDVAAHQPHPPGSPYFILLGRAALAVLGDDNASLQSISVLASIGAVLAEYALARVLFGKQAAVLAALLLLTQPVFWGYGTTASAWTLLALLSICIALVAALLVRGHRRLVYPSALLLGFASGFRAAAAVFLAPLWLWSVSRARPGRILAPLAVALAAACALVWLIPVSASAGGAVVWSERLLALLPAADGASPAEARQLAANTAIAFGTLAFTLGPALVLSFLLDRQRANGWLRSTLRSQTGVFLALWILPAFTFLWLVDSTEPGHDLVFVGALTALGAGLLVYTSPRWHLLSGVILAGLQAAVFLFAAPQANRPFAWTINSMLLNVTAPGLLQQQASLDATLRTIQTNFDPRETLVITLLGQDPYRFLMYYLPDYRVVRLDPSNHSLLTAHGGSQGNWIELNGCLVDPAQVRNAVWVLATPTEPGTVPEGASLLTAPEVASGPFQVWQLDPSATSTSDGEYLGFSLSSTACRIQAARPP
jgi:4-amino-4-deoxy-L-arabinose transferase-like glycosyltransferase